MKKLLTVCCLLPLFTNAQKANQCQIKGYSTTFNNQKLWIWPPLQTDFDAYYDMSNFGKNSELEVKDNKFSYIVETDYPQPLKISLFNEKERRILESNLFFIDKGTTNIKVDSAGGRPTVATQNSKLTDEYNKQEHLFDSSFANSENSATDLERFNRIKNYIHKNPSSFAALWLLISSYSKYAYSNEIDSLSLLFSAQVKKTKPYEGLRRKLIGDYVASVGNKFPFDFFAFGKEIESSCSKSKFVLVDFWASYCAPCKAQFPELKGLYEKYKSKGFGIVGVSIDDADYRQRADSVITNYSLPWKSYFDVDRKQSAKINIVAIPDNFLLDSNGIIIRRDISPEDLATFLADELKSTDTASNR